MIWFLICLFILVFGLIGGYYMIKYRNPYKLIMVFGKKGSGKTTFLCKLTQQYIKRGRPVYSTEYIPGAFKIDPEDVGKYHFPPESVILMDEVGMIYDNRDYKNFKPEVRDYFKLQRHYRHTIYLFSQTFDIDLKLRVLCDKMYLMVNYFGFLSIGKEIKRKIVVVKPSENAESRIADELMITPLLLTPFGARIFIFIPRWAKYFDSHSAPELKKDKKFKLVEYPEGIRIRKKKVKMLPRMLPFKERNQGVQDNQVVQDKPDFDFSSLITKISAGSGEAAADDHKE